MEKEKDEDDDSASNPDELLTYLHLQEMSQEEESHGQNNQPSGFALGEQWEDGGGEDEDWGSNLEGDNMLGEDTSWF